MNTCRLHRITSWVLQIIAAVILLQTLLFKFSGAEESTFIFTQLGVEPWGRIATGMMELLAAIFLLWNRMAVFGAILGLGLMAGAILSHLTKLGIVVQNDGGLLFVLALVVFLACAVIVWLRRYQLPYFGSLLFHSERAKCGGSVTTS